MPGGIHRFKFPGLELNICEVQIDSSESRLPVVVLEGQADVYVSSRRKSGLAGRTKRR